MHKKPSKRNFRTHRLFKMKKIKADIKFPEGKNLLQKKSKSKRSTLRTTKKRTQFPKIKQNRHKKMQKKN